MRRSLQDLVDRAHRDSVIVEEFGGAAGRHDVESHRCQLTRQIGHRRLVVVAHGDENRAALRQVDPGAKLRLGEGAGEIAVQPHHLAGRFHLRAKHHIDAGEPREREHRFLDRDMGADAAAIEIEGGKFLPGHDSGGDLGDGNAGGLGDKRHRATGPGVHLQHVNIIAFDRELHIHQAHNVQAPG